MYVYSSFMLCIALASPPRHQHLRCFHYSCGTFPGRPPFVDYVLCIESLGKWQQFMIIKYHKHPNYNTNLG